MCILRAVFTALIAISVTMLPVSGALAHAHAASQPSLHAVDCCGAMLCKNHVGDCGSQASCALKCVGIFGTVPPGIVIAASPVAAKAVIAGGQDFHVPATAPPLPPPRV